MYDGAQGSPGQDRREFCQCDLAIAGIGDPDAALCPATGLSLRAVECEIERAVVRDIVVVPSTEVVVELSAGANVLYGRTRYGLGS